MDGLRASSNGNDLARAASNIVSGVIAVDDKSGKRERCIWTGYIS